MRHVLLFDDVVKLEEEEIQHVLSDDLDSLASAMIGVDGSISQFIISNLTKSAKIL